MTEATGQSTGFWSTISSVDECQSLQSGQAGYGATDKQQHILAFSLILCQLEALGSPFPNCCLVSTWTQVPSFSWWMIRAVRLAQNGTVDSLIKPQWISSSPCVSLSLEVRQTQHHATTRVKLDFNSQAWNKCKKDQISQGFVPHSLFYDHSFSREAKHAGKIFRL